MRLFDQSEHCPRGHLLLSQLKMLLADLELPAFLAHAVGQRAEPPFLDAVQSLPEWEYGSIDETVEEVLRKR